MNPCHLRDKWYCGWSGNHLGVICANKKHDKAQESKFSCTFFCSNWPRKPITHQLRSHAPGFLEAPVLGHLHLALFLCLEDAWNRHMWTGSGVAEMCAAVCMLQSIRLQCKAKQSKTRGGDVCGVWKSSSRLASMKTTVVPTSNRCSEKRMVPYFLLWLGNPGEGWQGYRCGDMFCVCTVYAITALMTDLVGFVLLPSRFVNSLCSFSFVLHD